MSHAIDDVWHMCTVHDTQCLTHGACQWCMAVAPCVVQDTWCKVRGAGCKVRGARCKVRGARCMVRGVRCMVHGVWSCCEHDGAWRAPGKPKPATVCPQTQAAQSASLNGHPVCRGARCTVRGVLRAPLCARKLKRCNPRAQTGHPV